MFHLPKVDWSDVEHLIKHEGLYFFGGKGIEGFLNDQLYCLKSFDPASLNLPPLAERPRPFPNNVLKWKKIKTEGESPGPLYSHSMHFYAPLNSILIYGGK